MVRTCIGIDEAENLFVVETLYQAFFASCHVALSPWNVSIVDRWNAGCGGWLQGEHGCDDAADRVGRANTNLLHAGSRFTVTLTNTAIAKYPAVYENAIRAHPIFSRPPEPGCDAISRSCNVDLSALFYVLAALLVLVGLVVAYACRGSATGLAAQHIEAQIKLFWSVFWISIVLWGLIAVSAVASMLLIGIPFLMLFGLLLLLVSIWFTVKSVLGLLALLNDRPA